MRLRLPKLPKFIVRVDPYERGPRWYGVVHFDRVRLQALMVPIPFNVPIRVAIHIYWDVVCGWPFKGVTAAEDAVYWRQEARRLDIELMQTRLALEIEHIRNGSR